MQKYFAYLASRCSTAMGSPWAFIAACALVLGWAVSGRFFGYSDTWELVINTATTIITFLMVFLIQNSQNRDARALHIKLNELIHSIAKADNRMMNIEKLGPEELEALSEHYANMKDHLDDMKIQIHGKKRSAKLKR